MKISTRAVRRFTVAMFLHVALTGGVNAAPIFTVQQLPFSATDINDAGQVLGSIGGQAALLINGVQTTLGPGPALAINNNGEVLGENWLWKPGVGRTTPGFSRAVSFNNVGQVVGRQTFSDESYIWNASTGQQQITISYQGGEFVETRIISAREVNDSGEVAMNFDLWGGGGVWRSPGDTVEWQPLQNQCCTPPTFGLQLNNAGNGAGVALLSRSSMVEALLPAGLDPADVERACDPAGCGGLLLVDPTGTSSFVALLGWNDHFGNLGDLNDSSVMVGQAGRYEVLGSGRGNYLFEEAAFIASQDYGLMYLDELIDPALGLPDGVKLVDALAINNLNQVIAVGSDGMSYLLTPVPLPAAVWLFSGALLGLGMLRRRASQL